MALVWVGGKRFKDADCVSVRSSNLKIKKAAFIIPILLTPSVLQHSHSRRGEGGHEQCRTAVNAVLIHLLNAQSK